MLVSMEYIDSSQATFDLLASILLLDIIFYYGLGRLLYLLVKGSSDLRHTSVSSLRNRCFSSSHSFCVSSFKIRLTLDHRHS